MSKTVNKLYKHNTTIYKVILFLITTVAIVYLFPKGGQFKYEFTKGKPWQYDNLYAPFDFAIDKSEEEIEEEIKAIEEAAKLYFQFNKAIVSEVKEAYQLRVSVYNVSDSLSKNDIDFMVLTGNSIIDNVYKNGFIEVTSEGIISDKNSFIALKRDNQVQDIIYNNLLYSKDVFELIKNSLGDQPYTYSQNINLSILSEVIKPNVSYDNEFTQKVIDESVNEISLSKGKVSVGELIILKGDIVEGKKWLFCFHSRVSQSQNFGQMLIITG